MTILLAVLALGSIFLLAPAHSKGPLKTPSAGAATKPSLAPSPKAAAAPAASAATAASARLAPYRGLGAWVSLYDYDLTTQPIDPAASTALMASRGVQTLYLQTSRWNLPNALDAPVQAGRFIEEAHAHGIKVVAWYLPGFVDVGADVARTMAGLTFTTPKGQHFDAIAPDIEDRFGVNNDIVAFDNGVANYAKGLRAAAGAGPALGAIVPDALNNERAPGTWQGFPWPEIGKDFDVVMPMGYWSVTKPTRQCGIEIDAGGYTKRLGQLTTQLMGVTRPMVVVGGIGDCTTPTEVQAYVEASDATGMLGVSIYSFETVEHNPGVTAFWKSLQRWPR